MMEQAFGAYRAVVAEIGSDARAAAWTEVCDYLTRFENSGMSEIYCWAFIVGPFEVRRWKDHNSSGKDKTR